jgi:hypothetical protein
MQLGPTGGRLFHWTVGVLRPGDVLRHDAHVSDDPAEALAQEWREVGEGADTPFSLQGHSYVSRY